MRGYLWTGGQGPARLEGGGCGRLARWEAIAVDAVGNVIEFWGFKRNEGRVWALLYLRGEPLAAGELEQELALSKGAVSMLVRDLERWGVVLRVRDPGSTAWKYQAETDFMKMVRRVVEEREAAFISRIHADLAEARRLASLSEDVPRERLLRLSRMTALAELAERAVQLFLQTSRLDVGAMFGTLLDTGQRGE